MNPKNTVSAKKIAELTGVSLSTVSIVLNNKGEKYRISDKTKARVLEAANELGYHHVKKEMRKKSNLHQSLISIFCPMNIDNSVLDRFYFNFQKYLKDQKLPYELILFPYELGKLKAKEPWLSKDFATGGLMIALTDDDIEFIESKNFNIPLVLYNRTAKGYCCVLNDDYNVGYKAMSHFIKREHKKFAIISPNYSSRALSLRTVGYMDGFHSQKFCPKDSFILPVIYDDDTDAGGYRAVLQLLKSRELPTALFLPSDNMVSGAARCISENGLQVPKDLEIISYGDRLINRIVKPSITSFAPSVEELSYHCIRLLHEQISKGNPMNNAKLVFEAKCVFRESSPEV